MSKKSNTHPFLVVVSSSKRDIIRERFRVRQKAEIRLRELQDQLKDKGYIIEIKENQKVK